MFNIHNIFGFDSSSDSANPAVSRAIQEVRSAPEPQTRGGFCKLILKLVHLRPKAEGKAQKRELESVLDTLSRQYMRLSKQYVDCLDTPFAEREELYREMAQRHSARDACHLGELMLMREESAGVQHIFNAAAQGDVRATFIAAKIWVDGMFNCPADPKKARDLLVLAAKNKYAPALELIAGLYWDGDGNWDFPRNREKALQYMEAAIKIYDMYSFNSPKQQKAYAEHCRCMRHIAGRMLRLIDGELKYLPTDFCPSFLALRLSFYPMNEAGLRARAHYISQYIAHYGRTFYLGDYYWNVSLPLISLSIEEPNDEYLGYAQWSQVDNKIRFHICIAPESLPRTSSIKTYWFDERRVNSTIAHELAHCYLVKQFNSQLSNRHPFRLHIIEGHATNCQYQFTRLAYHKGRLTREQFTDRHEDFLCTEYVTYFNYFRDNFIGYDDMADWKSLSAYIRSMGNDASRRSVVQIANKEVYQEPIFYGLGFNGYL